MSGRTKTTLARRKRLARNPPDIDLLWRHGDAGWHPAPAGLVNETDAGILRDLSRSQWELTVFTDPSGVSVFLSWRF